MKLKVKIDGQIYDVEVGNLSERPISAVVNGETFEVWPESNMPITAPSPMQTSRKEVAQDTAVKPSTFPASSPSKSNTNVAATPKSSEAGTQSDLLKAVKAPIPGVITAILVQPGSEVSVGQELCKLEAMKMNNSIRSSRIGKIASINVSIGQHVKHNDVLIEYAG